MNIIILYEHIVRELEAIRRLQKKLNERKHVVKIFSGDFEMTKAYSYAKKNKIEVILMPWFVDDEHFDLIYPIVKSNPKIKIINLHHEQISSPVYENVLFPQSDLTKKNSYHFAWGKYFENQLISRGIAKDRIYITGNIRNDKAFQIEYTKETLADKFHLDKTKKWILYAENRGFSSQRMNESMKMVLRKRGLSDEEIQESMQNTTNSLSQFYEILRNFPGEFLSHYEFIYRPHPGTQMVASLPDKIHVICELPIYEWISNSDLFVTCESTSIFEAEICGVPCVTFNNLPASDKYLMAGINRYPSLESLTDINDELIEIVKKNQRKTPIYADYLGKVDGHSVDRAVEAIEDVGNQDTKIDFLGHELSRKILIRRYLYEFATRISVKTGLLDKIKFPNSSYWSSRDIPYTKYNKNTYFFKPN